MKASIFCYSLKGRETARKVAKILINEYSDPEKPKQLSKGKPIEGQDTEGTDQIIPIEIECFSPERLAEGGFMPIPKPSGEFYGEHFNGKDLLISVGSVGIAVRHMAPYLKSKVTDPAVIVIDELGQHVIPVLSGHIGGANRMALELAEKLGGEAVITTATDINGRFAVDEWAARKGFAISSMKTAKDFSAAILERDLPLKSDFVICGELPKGLRKAKFGNISNLTVGSGNVDVSDLAASSEEDIQAAKEGTHNSETGDINCDESRFENVYRSDSHTPNDLADIGLYVTWTKSEPFGETLRLVPKCLYLGIGCRKGIDAESVRQAVKAVAEEHSIDLRAVKGIASIDLKKDEAGLLEFAREMGMEPEFFSAKELEAVEGEFTPSEFVKGVTGVDNVCERAALVNADRLIVKKTALNGVTVAVGLKDVEIIF